MTKNMPCFRFSCLLLTSFLLLAAKTAEASTPLFNIIATKKAPYSLLANEVSYAQYQIVNNTKQSRFLAMNYLPGVTQLTGPGLCASPFLLAPRQSCTLNLRLDASSMHSIDSGPVICAIINGKPSPFLCSQPNSQNELHIKVTPCAPEKCLPATITAQLRAITSQFRLQNGIPGIVSGIWLGRSGQLIIEDGLSNLATLKPISRFDHFRIGSITKTFTVTVMLQLIEQQLLQLTTPLSQFLPGLQNSNSTMEQLASMTSGIFNYTEDSNFVNIFVSDLARVWFPSELIAVGNANLPYFPAGADWHYSNTNTVILGVIIEMITQNAISDEIQQRLLNPLKLSNTFYTNTLPMPEPFAHGYGFSPLQDVTNTSPTSAAASGAMISDLYDLRTWAIVLGTGQMLTSAMQSLRLASLKPIIYSPCADTVPGRPPAPCPAYDEYGMGIGKIQNWIGHTAEFVGYTSLVMYNPQTGSTVVILMNTFGNDLSAKLFNEYLAILPY